MSRAHGHRRAAYREEETAVPYCMQSECRIKWYTIPASPTQLGSTYATNTAHNRRSYTRTIWCDLGSSRIDSLVDMKELILDTSPQMYLCKGGKWMSVKKSVPGKEAGIGNH